MLCEICGTETGKRRKRFCSVECRRANVHNLKLVCKHCEKSHTRLNSKFCSTECRIEHSKALIKVLCEVCGIEIVGRTSRAKYCSKECSNIGERKDYTCVMCGEVNSVRTSTISGNKPYRCRICGLREHYKNKVKHMNGDYISVVVVDNDGSRKQIREHRHVVESSIGRKLSNEEHVHHIDFVKINNKIDNLAVLSMQEHRLAEKSIYELVRKLLLSESIIFNRKTKVYEIPLEEDYCDFILP